MPVWHSFAINNSCRCVKSLNAVTRTHFECESIFVCKIRRKKKALHLIDRHFVCFICESSVLIFGRSFRRLSVDWRRFGVNDIWPRLIFFRLTFFFRFLFVFVFIFVVFSVNKKKKNGDENEDTKNKRKWLITLSQWH